jgi:hypothetical protein
MTCNASQSPHGRQHLAVAMLLLLVSACASRPSDGPRQYLDQKSAATVTVSEGALVFARERPELAVHARDYLTLVPVDVNRMGTHVLYFYGFVWSTIDKRGSQARDDDAVQFEIVADGRRIPLVPVRASPHELGLGDPPVRAPSKSARLLIAETDRDALAYLAAAGTIRAAELHDGVSETYELWSGNPGSLAALRQK